MISEVKKGKGKVGRERGRELGIEIYDTSKENPGRERISERKRERKQKVDEGWDSLSQTTQKTNVPSYDKFKGSKYMGCTSEKSPRKKKIFYNISESWIT